MRKPSVNLDEKWIGFKKSKLTVIGFGYDPVHQNNKWICKCDCGKIVSVFPGNLKSGRVHSCGCLQLEKATKHNMKHTRMYSI